MKNLCSYPKIHAVEMHFHLSIQKENHSIKNLLLLSTYYKSCFQIKCAESCNCIKITVLIICILLTMIFRTGSHIQRIHAPLRSRLYVKLPM